MGSSLLDRVGLGNRRAVANARLEVLRRPAEEQLVSHLVETLTRHDRETGSHAGDVRADAVGPAA